MAHGLHLWTHRHPPFPRITGEQALNITAILIIALFVLVLVFWATLGYL
jgi:hypothetical protein